MPRLSPITLAQLQPLLAELQQIPGLVQTKPAIFYCRRIPLLHFHETEQGVVADLKRIVPVPSGFDRLETSSAAARKKLIKEVATRCTLLAARTTAKRS